MADVPQFRGIRKTNMQYADLWKPINFPRALAVSVVNHLADAHRPVNLVTVNRSRVCHVGEMDVEKLYNTPAKLIPTLSFDFDSQYPPFSEIADNVPKSPLVIRDQEGWPLRRLDVMSSVVPDFTTKGLPPTMSGPEMNVKTDTAANLALSMATSLMPEKEKALEILKGDIPDDVDWTSWDSASTVADEVQGTLDEIVTTFNDLQSPFLLQSVWRSDDEDLYMADDAMDAFVWTDMAFSRLFLDAPSRATSGMSRLKRCSVRVHRIMTLALSGERSDVASLMKGMSYGVSGDKEFMVNGKYTNRLMACDRLTRPALSRLDVTFLASLGFEDMLKPERNLGDAVYYAVKELRGGESRRGF